MLLLRPQVRVLAVLIYDCMQLYVHHLFLSPLLRPFSISLPLSLLLFAKSMCVFMMNTSDIDY